MAKEELNKETQDLYWLMYQIVHRKHSEDKNEIFQAAQHMISAIDECWNLPKQH